MADFELEHRAHPHHASVAATGLALQGPFGDGFIQLTFYRDAMRTVKETYQGEEKAIPGGTALTLTKQTGAEIVQFREDMSTVLVPADKFQSFAEAVQRMQRQLDSLKTTVEE